MSRSKNYAGKTVAALEGMERVGGYEPGGISIRFTDDTVLIVRAATVQYDQYSSGACLRFEETEQATLKAEQAERDAAATTVLWQLAEPAALISERYQRVYAQLEHPRLGFAEQEYPSLAEAMRQMRSALEQIEPGLARQLPRTLRRAALSF